jgi:murein hydrolase activator
VRVLAAGRPSPVPAPTRRATLSRVAGEGIAALVFAVFLCVLAQAEESPQKALDSVEAALKAAQERQAALTQEADRLATEIEELRAQSVAAAQTAQQHEAALSDLEAKLAAMGADEAQKSTELGRQRAMQDKLLMALVRLARNPPEGLALAAEEPVDVLRGAALLSAALTPIEERAKHLKSDLDALAALRHEIAAAWRSYAAEHEALVADQLRVASLIAQKTELQQQAARDAAATGRREKQLAARAQDLHELIDKLEAKHKSDEAERQGAEARPRVAALTPPPALPRPFTEAEGHLVFPVSGKIVRRYGEADELGVTSKGLTFRTRPEAQVVAPYDGRILFAGPFQGYGQILIIGHGDGYHTLLAGLDRIDGSVGQWLVAGEPVGAMAGGAGKPRLYLELRHNNQPINPLPWLPHRDEKVSG